MAKTATAEKPTTGKGKGKGKAGKEQAAEVVLPEADLEELEADEVTEGTPKGKTGKNAAQEITFGVQDIVKHLNGKGNNVNARGIRTLIRKMARDGTNRVDREIVAGNRTRYDWPKGLKDPEVKKIIAAFESGELEEDKKEKLQALKDRKAAKDKAEGKVTGKKTKAGKTKEKAGKGKGKVAAPATGDDDEELTLDD